jgi:hypothetical protein
MVRLSAQGSGTTTPAELSLVRLSPDQEPRRETKNLGECIERTAVPSSAERCIGLVVSGASSRSPPSTSKRVPHPLTDLPLVLGDLQMPCAVSEIPAPHEEKLHDSAAKEKHEPDRSRRRFRIFTLAG